MKIIHPVLKIILSSFCALACLTDDSLVSQKNVLPSSAAKVVQLTEDSIDHRYPFLESNCSRVKVETRSAKDRYELESGKVEI